jgi:hypothetical protein
METSLIMTAVKIGVFLSRPIKSGDGFLILKYKWDSDFITITASIASLDQGLSNWLDIRTPVCSKKFKI